MPAPFHVIAAQGSESTALGNAMRTQIVEMLCCISFSVVEETGSITKSEPGHLTTDCLALFFLGNVMTSIVVLQRPLASPGLQRHKDVTVHVYCWSANQQQTNQDNSGFFRYLYSLVVLVTFLYSAYNGPLLSTSI